MRACPKCQSSRVHHSRARSFVERGMTKCGLVYFRCHDCQWRGTMRAQASNAVSSTHDRNRFLKILFGLIMLVLIVLIFFA